MEVAVPENVVEVEEVVADISNEIEINENREDEIQEIIPQPEIDENLQNEEIIEIPRAEIEPQDARDFIQIENNDDIEILGEAEMGPVNAPDLIQIENDNFINIPQAQNEHEHVPERDENNDETPRKRRRFEEKEKKEKEIQDEEQDPEEYCCQICMEPWTNFGSHRLCSLACGHLFGQECVVRWLRECSASTRRCPICNLKADLREVRIIYATKLTAIDTSELDRLRTEVEVLGSKNKMLELQLSTAELRNRVFQEQVEGLMRKISELENKIEENSITMKEKVIETMQSSNRMSSRKFHMEKSIEIDANKGCRVFDYNHINEYLAISQKTSARYSMFAGYGVKIMDVNLLNAVAFVPIHQDVIRDISFHPIHQSLLLSVSYDKTAKLIDINTKSVVHNFPIGLRASSSCWSGDNSNIFLVGCEQGKVVQFDIRQTSGAVDTLFTPGVWSPVVSLASVPPSSSPGIPRGGFLACMLNSCYAYEPKNNTYAGRPMFTDGSYFCVRYDQKTSHGLISCRGKNSRGCTSSDAQAKHSVFSIERSTNDSICCQIVHNFEVGQKQSQMSRPCFVDVKDDTLIAAHQESTSCIPLRCLSTGKLVHSIPVQDPVVDICSFQAQDKICLATLSSSHLRLYHHSKF